MERLRPVPGVLDTVRSVGTPEGIDLDLRLAGPVPRAYAWLIDLLLRLMIMSLLWLALIPLGGFGMGVWLLSAFFLEWLYPAVCEVWFSGATPGKKVMGLQVVHDDGTPVAWPAALVRNLLRAVDFLPLLYGAGLVSILVSRDFKRLGDVVAGTLVVYRESPRKAVAIPPATPLRSPIALELAESRALLDFAARVATLTPQRAEELAEIPTALAGGARGAAACDRLLQIANDLLGRRAR